MDSLLPAIILALGVSAVPGDDKKLHFLAGAATAEFGRQMSLSPLQSCGLSLAAGVAKEAFDGATGGTRDDKDVLATALGCSFTLRF